MRLLGGSVKRSLAMACLGRSITIAKAFGLDAATRIECHFFVVHPCRDRIYVTAWSFWICLSHVRR